ncbi:hypothetical protein [Cohnella cholangitidis]|uniref:Uncharacterized protein n=1 Tax=Cohnella cholangitidis TaxID=2598458 RepID=A0A7G5BU57_9BACL|nr:hypothetical protein [Cohnella cholangitidis]QMV40491.1 hypothetical protein FPL14_04185 [Cohnella cholangitidis]
MKTSELTAAEFAAHFGASHVLPGPFAYFACDNGMGVIRDNRDRTIEIVNATEQNLAEISPEDELLLLAMVCGEYREEVAVPRSDTVFDYEERYRKTTRKYNVVRMTIIILLSLFISLSLILFFLLME